MSTGSPNPGIPPTAEHKKEIPLSWFAGVGRKDGGIMFIAFSELFESMGNGEVGKHMAQYGHYMGNTFIGNRLVENSLEIEDEPARKIVQEAERRIKEITGFTPKELSEKKHELSKAYKGKQEAPFYFELG